MGNQVDGRFDRRSSVNWRWKNDPHLIGDHFPILISDQADWSLIGGGKTGPYSLQVCNQVNKTITPKH